MVTMSGVISITMHLLEIDPLKIVECNLSLE